MTFLQALYGSQYREISQKGKDGAKGRLNGNLFLCAFILLIVFTIITSILTFYPSSNNAFTKAIRKIYPFESGKMIAFELTPPVFGLLYLFVANTVGSIANFNRLIAKFNNFPSEQKAKANKRVLVPFFIVLIIFFVLEISPLRQ